MNDYLDEFLDVKRLEGCSEGTLEQYRFHISKFLRSINKDVTEITTQDIRKYLANYKQERQISNVTLDNMRRNFGSFFSYLHNEGIIARNPNASVNKIKATKVIKNPFTEEEMEILRDNCKNLRERALIEVLYSTGMRIGELEKLNIEDVDWQKKSIIVFGKGAKEREVYLNARAEISLRKYLSDRKDTNLALFVGLVSPFTRVKKSTLEKNLRELGERCGVLCHAHKFRRTCATNLLGKGMPIQEVSMVLGHAKLETTMIYCNVDQETVMTNHKKFMN